MATRLFALIGMLCSAAVARAACTDGPDPSFGVLADAALKIAALEPERLRSLLRRARVAGILPQVSVRVGKGGYDSIRDADTLDPTILSSDTWHYEVLARFSLDRLIFDTHELRAAEAAGRLAEHRVALLEHLSGWWSARRALLHTTDPAHAAERETRCEELTALLDTLTGGAVSHGGEFFTARSASVIMQG